MNNLIKREDGYQYEIMDRASNACGILELLFDSHPGMTTELNEKYTEAMKALCDMYQMAGEIYFNGLEEREKA